MGLILQFRSIPPPGLDHADHRLASRVDVDVLSYPRPPRSIPKVEEPRPRSAAAKSGRAAKAGSAAGTHTSILENHRSGSITGLPPCSDPDATCASYRQPGGVSDR
jgi:hypothetical protein